MHILSVQSDNVDEQLIEVIRYFNICVNEENIFSRCQLCNCNEFILLTQNDVMQMNRYYMERDIQPPYNCRPANRSWNVRNLTLEDRRTGKTLSGAKMNIFGIPEHLLRANYYYYVCEVSFFYLYVH